IRVEGQHRERSEHHIVDAVLDFAWLVGELSSQSHRAGSVLSGERRLDFIGKNRVGGKPLKTKHDGSEGAVTVAGCCERAVKVDPDSPGVCEEPLVDEVAYERLRGPHGPHGVRA